jgi:hypothetical protein
MVKMFSLNALLFLLLLISFSFSSFILAERGTWSDTARDLIATTQDDPNYKHVIVQELLASGANYDGNSFADAICSRPNIVRCIGNNGEAKGSAASQSWPIEITIRQFNGTVHYEKLPKATQSLVIQESIIPVDVSDLISRLPNGIERLKFLDSHLTTSGGNIFTSSGNENNNNINNQNSDKQNSAAEPQLSTVTSVWFERCRIDDTVLETGWLPVSSLKSFSLIRNSFSTSSIAPLLVGASEIEEIKVISNDAPLRFRELLGELSLRSELRSIDFQAAGPQPQSEQDAKMIVAVAAGLSLFPKNLVHLRLANLSLKEVPRSLPPKLNTLELQHNMITTGGEALGEILVDTVLEMFDFSNNSISEFPSRLPATIKKIRIASNQLRGKMDFSALPKDLEELSIAHNQLSGGADLTRLPGQLQILDIAYNKFSGSINMREFPDSVRYVFLHFNEFTGRYDVSRLPLLSVRVLFGGNKWDSLIPRR